MTNPIPDANDIKPSTPDERLCLAVADFDIESLKKACQEPIQFECPDWEWAKKCADWAQAYNIKSSRQTSITPPNPSHITQGFDLILGNMEPSLSNATQTMINQEGWVLKHLMGSQHENVQAWIEEKQLQVNELNRRDWLMGIFRKRMAIADLSKEAGVRSSSTTTPQIQAALLVMSVLRGDSLNQIKALELCCPVVQKEDIALSVAELLILRRVNNLNKTCQIIPSIEGLLWLGQVCPLGMIMEKTMGIAHDNEGHQAAVSDFVYKIQTAIEFHQLDTQTAMASKNTHTLTRL